jgi:hypothetical protein
LGVFSIYEISNDDDDEGDDVKNSLSIHLIICITSGKPINQSISHSQEKEKSLILDETEDLHKLSEFEKRFFFQKKRRRRNVEDETMVVFT